MRVMKKNIVKSILVGLMTAGLTACGMNNQNPYGTQYGNLKTETSI